MENRTFIITAHSRSEIEDKIDNFLSEGKYFNDIPLILSVGNSRRYNYRDVSIREWWDNGNVRYDSALELIDAEERSDEAKNFRQYI